VFENGQVREGNRSVALAEAAGSDGLVGEGQRGGGAIWPKTINSRLSMPASWK
jgi:hypothetical protein